MHFHLPKPLHGWREFAGEVGIIVVGVLIALGAEQVVEAAHWRHQAEQAKASLGDEIADHYFTASEIVIAQPCIDRQLTTLEQSLLKPAPYVPAPSYPTGLGDFPYRAPTRVWADNVWRAASSDGTTSHFDADLRLELSSYYAQLEAMRDSNHDTDLLWWRLRILSQPIQPDATTRANLIQQLEEARGHFAFMKLIGNQLLGTIEVVKMQPPADYTQQALAQSGTLQFCRAHHFPLGHVDPQRTVPQSVSAFEHAHRRN
jgi:hypothetical protein